MFWFVIVAGPNSVISIYYYFKVAMAMFLMRPAEEEDTSPLRLHWPQYTVPGAPAVPTLALGLFSGGSRGLADRAVALMTTGV